MHTSNSRRRLYRLLLLSLLIVAAAAGFVLTHRYTAFDWLKLHNYQPSAAIAQLASNDTMTAATRRVYYVNHPQLNARSNFTAHCPSGTEQTVVLGCYQSNQEGIYLLQVINPELAGIEQVTAAHETLHAEYDRLSTSKRKQVDSMLLDYYNHGLTDPVIKQTMRAYQKSEPTQLVNEMHSIFGTEVTNLPAGLEAYYKQYFTDRSKITGYYTTYQAAFTSRQAQIKQDDVQLAIWKSQISSQTAIISSQQTTLQATKARLDSERSSAAPADYNQYVTSYNRLVANYNAQLDNLRSLIARYNQLVGDRSSIALEEQQLVQSISSPKMSAQ